MSQTKFDICTRALTRVGANPIASFDSSAEGIVAGNEYEPTLTSELGKHRWRFATDQAELVRLAAEPAARFAYAFQLPAGLLKLHAVTRNDLPIVYDRYGDKIFTDEDDGLVADFTFRAEEPMFPPEFTDALVLTLGAIFAVALDRDFTLAKNLKAEADGEPGRVGAWAKARLSNSQQQTTRRIAPSRLVSGRF